MYIASGHPSGKATASLICGIFFFILPSAVCAIILGHIALSEIKKSAGKLIGEGRAIAGLVLGYIGIAGIPLILIIAAIAIPNLLRAHSAANEASALGSVRAINIAEVAYQSAYPDVGFACSLQQLGGDGGDVGSTSAGLIDSQLASGFKSGYRFRVSSCKIEDGKVTSYQLVAFPISAENTGRSFCSDQSGIIRFVTNQSRQGCLESGIPLQ